MGVLRFIPDAFAGKASLFHAFVFCYLAFIFPVAALLARARQWQAVDPASMGARAILMLLLCYVVWVSVALWRCAPNTAKPRAILAARVGALLMGVGGAGAIAALW